MSERLAHLVKEVRKGKAKTSKTQLGEWKEGDKDAKTAKAHIFMIRRESETPKRKAMEEPAHRMREITIPPILGKDNSSDPKAKFLGREVNRDSRIHLIGFSGEHSWSHREIPLEITIGESPFTKMDVLDFVIVRSDSPHNMIIGRTAMQKMGIIVSTIHRAIKFHTSKGIDTVSSVYETDKTRKGQKKPKEAPREETKETFSCMSSEKNYRQ
ncbi:hypothetical protein Tco_0043650 [Tanacetum coccineum]